MAPSPFGLVALTSGAGLYNCLMAASILATKIFIPTPRRNMVSRPRLVERMDEALHRKLTLVSASAGFGKTTAVAEWVAGCGEPLAWLSLDEGDNDPIRFLTYLIAALQTVEPDIGRRVVGVLQSPQPPTIESALTDLLNEISGIKRDFVLVIDDYHWIESKAVDEALTFLLEHQPAQMHLVIATREDPHLPLAQLRTQGQLTELRINELRFAPSEAGEFLSQVMGLNLSTKDVEALEARTEGWIAGLQLAALSMQGGQDTTEFIQSFTGTHRFVLDYLVEQVLGRLPENIQTFLLRTSILERLCGPLCEALLPAGSAPAQETLEYLEHANLFTVPLDNERRWYRYHQLFADLLRQRLQQSGIDAAELHRCASAWYEGNGFEIEAFQHAAAADDIERAARLLQGRGMPLHLRGGMLAALKWLESLPAAALDARPELWVTWAGALTAAGQTPGVEEKLQAAERALQGATLDVRTRDLIGRIANNRATLAVSQYRMDEAIQQAERALEYLPPENLAARGITNWTLGAAHQDRGDRTAATQAFSEAISTSRSIGYIFVMELATVGLASLQESQNDLHLAAETYRQALEMFGDEPLPFAEEGHMGLARISYEWNDLEAAEQHGQQGLHIARQYSGNIDRFVIAEVFLARLRLARGDAAGADEMLARTRETVRQRNFMRRVAEVAAAQALTWLRQGNVTEAAALAQKHELPLSQARVHLAQGDPAAALAVLEPYRQHVEDKGWEDERLKVMILEAVALDARGEKEDAVQRVSEALALAEPGGFIRSFVDEGPPMAQLISEAAARGILRAYTAKILAAFEGEGQAGIEKMKGGPAATPSMPLIEPLSGRELEILRFIAKGLSNQVISERLFLALSTVKGHNRKIFDKLQVKNRTEAVARARELGLL